MLKVIKTLSSGEALSAFSVILVACLTGAKAAEGLTAVQWASGLTAVAATIAWAVMVRVWPKPARMLKA